MPHHHYDQQSPSSPPSSAKPLLLALAAIFVIIGIFILKNTKNDAEDGSAKTASFGQETVAIDVPTIQPEEVYKLITNNNYQLVDIREKTPFEQNHIESSTNIPFSAVSNSAKAFDKNKKIIIIDARNSAEGKMLTDHLIKEGLDARYMEGGIEKYYMKSLPLISFGNTESIRDKSKGTPLTASELNGRASNGERFKFIDVRPAADFEASHIEGSINIPLEDLETRKKDVPSGKIVMVDESPVRSFQAAVKLYDMNYWGVFYLSDSLSTLKAVVSGESTAAPPGEDTPSDHTEVSPPPSSTNGTIEPGTTINSPATNTPSPQ